MNKIVQLKDEVSDLIAPTRIWDWWEFKTPVFLGVAYFVAIMTNLDSHQIWIILIKIIIALIPCASFVCVINDITDEKEDIVVGKKNSMIGKSSWFKILWIVACLLGGIIGVYCLKNSTIAIIFYGVNWLIFALYSIPPLRLKSRGVWGVIADACGGQLFPTLWTTFMVSTLTNEKISLLLIITLSVWSFTLGIRGIISHQIADLINDQKSETKTMAVQFNKNHINNFLNYIIFPIEIISLILILIWFNSVFAWMITFLFIVGGWILINRKDILESEFILSTESLGAIFFKYYITFFPLCFLFAVIQNNPSILLLIPIHIILFPGSWGISLNLFRQSF